MDLLDDIWSDIFVGLVAILALPFYMGYLHAPLLHLLAYAVVAGSGLALGERLIYSYYQDDSMREFAFNAGLKAASVLIWGGTAFALALWLI